MDRQVGEKYSPDSFRLLLLFLRTANPFGTQLDVCRNYYRRLLSLFELLQVYDFVYMYFLSDLYSTSQWVACRLSEEGAEVPRDQWTVV